MWPPAPSLTDPEPETRQPEGPSTGFRFLIGLGGALVGVIVGLVAALLCVAETSDGNDLGEAFAFLGAAPVGMILGGAVGVAAALRASSYLRRADLGASAPRKKNALTLALAAGLPLLIMGMFQAAMHCDDPPPDRQLLANFSRHRAEFDKLAAMALADKKVTRVDDDWTAPDDPQQVGVPPARIAEYRRLLRGVGTPRGFQVSNSADIEFYYYLTGSAISSDTDKGYAYLAQPPPRPLSSLDGCRPDEKNGVLAYRHIAGHWYLFYDYIPG